MPLNPSPNIPWKISADPAVLTIEEFRTRYDHANMPEKIEMIRGQLFWSDEQRLHLLAMLLEAVGLHTALSLCPPETVRAAMGES
jgi:hypothetical protein